MTPPPPPEQRGRQTEVIWPANARYGQTPAPGTLAFVHDLLNTHSAGRPRQPDLLAQLDTAQAWSDAACQAWASTTLNPVPLPQLTDRDAEEILAFRDDLRTQLNRCHPMQAPQYLPARYRGTLAMRQTPDGTVAVQPQGKGWRLHVSMVLAAAYEAQLNGIWDRLKICRNARCAGAFFDRSRNNSGAWHDVRVCGNAANLRASRARRRASTDAPQLSD